MHVRVLCVEMFELLLICRVYVLGGQKIQQQCSQAERLQYSDEILL